MCQQNNWEIESAWMSFPVLNWSSTPSCLHEIHDNIMITDLFSKEIRHWCYFVHVQPKTLSSSPATIRSRCSLVTYKFLLSFSLKKELSSDWPIYFIQNLLLAIFFGGRYCALRWTNRTRSWFVISIDVNSLSGGRNFDVAVPQTQKRDSPTVCTHCLVKLAVQQASDRGCEQLQLSATWRKNESLSVLDYGIRGGNPSGGDDPQSSLLLPNGVQEANWKHLWWNWSRWGFFFTGVLQRTSMTTENQPFDDVSPIRHGDFPLYS